ncbi:uncharacterized protein [Anabrus simplex]|uniref:uncharacterized protein n=1 Tax=Anabrus simplex TaxID=316456 RepID=UPI0035A331E6
MAVNADMLPADVLLRIFSMCTYDDIVKTIPHVCSWWREVWRDKHLWKYKLYRPTCTNKEVIDMLELSPHLHGIDFSNCDFNIQIVEALREHCPELEQLCISSEMLHGVTKFNMTEIFNYIKVLIVNRRGRFCNALNCISNHFPNLEHLKFDNSYFTRGDLLHFLKVMQYRLRTLALRCNTSDGYCVLPYLQIGTQLESLSLLYLCDNVKQLPLDKVVHVRHVSSLSLEVSRVNFVNDGMTILTFFPNIVELYLFNCSISGEDFFHTTGYSCPLLKKLTLRSCSSLFEDHNLKNLKYFRKLTSLVIYNDDYIINEDVNHLQTLSELSYLELYDCKLLNTKCLEVICGFIKLQVLKFDLRYKIFQIHLTAAHLKNPNLQLIFYRCKDFITLEELRKQRLRVSALGEKVYTLRESVVL